MADRFLRKDEASGSNPDESTILRREHTRERRESSSKSDLNPWTSQRERSERPSSSGFKSRRSISFGSRRSRQSWIRRPSQTLRVCSVPTSLIEPSRRSTCPDSRPCSDSHRIIRTRFRRRRTRAVRSRTRSSRRADRDRRQHEQRCQDAVRGIDTVLPTNRVGNHVLR